MRIAIIGPQNTGKSTFIDDFINSHSEYFCPSETYRDVVAENNLEVNQKTTEKSQELIAKFFENVIRENKNENIIFDRSIIDNYVYSYIAYKKGNISKDYIDNLKLRVINNLKFVDLYVLIPTTVAVKLVDDEMRDIDVDFIDETNSVFVSFLFHLVETYKIKIFVLSGNREDRVNKLNEKLRDNLVW